MDNFEKDIRKQYDRQLKPVNPKAAWAKFEDERLGKEKKKRWIFPVLFVIALTLVGTWVVYFSLTSTNPALDQEYVVESVNSKNADSSEEFNPQSFVNIEQEETQNKIGKNFKNDNLIITSSDVSKIGADLTSGHIVLPKIATDREKLLAANGSDQLEISQETQLAVNSSVKTAIDAFTGNTSEDNARTEYLEQSKNNGEFIEQVNDKMLQSTKIGSVNSLLSEEDTFAAIPSVSLAETTVRTPLITNDRWMSYGFYTGTNTLNHRFIRRSNGANLGIVLQARLANRMSVNAIAGYSYLNFETRVNSKDLRIKSLNINTRRLEVTSINKSVHQFNSGIELALWPVKRKRFSMDLTAGVISKVDVMESHDYQVFANNMDSEIQQSTSLNYYYPAFYRVSTGINYSCNKTRIVLRPYYMHNVFASEINHPYEWGINTEFLF